MPKIVTGEEMIERFKKVHGDTYDYSKTIFVKTRVKVIVICKVHGEFEIQVNNHERGNGCKECLLLKREEARKKG